MTIGRGVASEPSIKDLTRQLARALAERDELRAQQAATGEVLEVIGRSGSDIQPVLNTMLASAARLCAADACAMIVKRDGRFHYQAFHGGMPELQRKLATLEVVPGRSSIAGRTLLDAQVVHVEDLHADPDYAQSDVLKSPIRTALAVPLLRDGEPVGVINLMRFRVEPFTELQVELVRTFADQAAMAYENARLFTETKEALQQQTATSNVLKEISSSTFDLTKVLQSLLDSAMHLGKATSGGLFLPDSDGGYRMAVAAGEGPQGTAPTLDKTLRDRPIRLGRDTTTGLALLERRTVHTPDINAMPDYRPDIVAVGAYRTNLAVPMLRDGDVVGVIVLTRGGAVSPFTDRHIELVETFAAQAVIAIENVRLFDGTREALERQTATANVLQVINASPGDLDPVFDAIVKNSMCLCDADGGGLWLVTGDAARPYGHRIGNWEKFEEHLGEESVPLRFLLGDDSPDQTFVHVDDMASHPAYKKGIPFFVASVDLIGYRTTLCVPVRENGSVIAVFNLWRNTVRPFADRQIELVRSFAAQAQIAMKNARLMNETREALERQTATAEILKVIASSPTNVQPVFDAIAERARLLCGAQVGSATRFDGECLHMLSYKGASPQAEAEMRAAFPVKPGHGSVNARAIVTAAPAQVPDCQLDRSYQLSGPVARAGLRSLLGVPMVLNGRVIGVIGLGREAPGHYSDNSIALLQTFADQAVIAVENVRLFSETREALERQTATSDILQVISDSPTDVQPVLDAIVRSAVPLCDGLTALFYQYDGALQNLVAQYFGGDDRDFEEGLKTLRALYPRAPQRSTATGIALLDGVVVHVSDLQGDLRFSGGSHSVALAAGYRSALAVPLLKAGEAIGVIYVVRREAGPFSSEQIALLESFASQAVIAIENVRLFTELRESLERLKAAQANLIQAEKLASLGQLTAGIAHEIKNPLNFINNFADLSAELVGELREALDPGRTELGAEARADVDELTEMISANLGKVSQHGRRADSIVKNMLLHSRGGGGERRRVDLNASVEESLNLAYHGARAEKPGFNITLEKHLDPALGEVEIYPQEFVRVLLNLISNGFYAAHQRKIDSADVAFEPTLRVTTRALGDRVEIRIRDNGTGIPDALKDKIFNPFFTTKPAGEGTGLGLSLSFDIVVKLHGGTIDIQTEPGAFTEFVVTVPRQLAAGGAPAAVPSP